MHIQQMKEIFHDDLGYTNVILLLMDGAKGRLQKNCVFYDIGLKGGWVPVSKYSFFYIRN